jgi:hypothetical protein
MIAAAQMAAWRQKALFFQKPIEKRIYVTGVTSVSEQAATVFFGLDVIWVISRSPTPTPMAQRDVQG